MCRPFEIESRLNVSHLLPGFNVPQQQQQQHQQQQQGMYAMSKQPLAAAPFMLSSFKAPQFDVMTTSANNFESFEDLLDCSILDDDSDLHLNVGDEDFDPTELAILSKYVEDIPLDDADNNNVKAEISIMDQQPGMVTLNLLDDMSLDLNMLSDEDMMLTNMQLKAPLDLNVAPMMMHDAWANQSSSCTSDDHHHDEHDPALPFKSRRFCSVDGCDKRSRSHGLCIAHGGGRRCAVEGCGKSSQGGNLCIKHGGGKRCQVENCDKAAQSNLLCKMHGGGPRCLFANCHRSSQGGGFCRTHGGGKRCLFEGCDKGTQRGDFCALHGGSRLCGVSGCMRNDRGGGFCATHGGGKRCSQEGCQKPCRRQGMCSTHLRLSGSA